MVHHGILPLSCWPGVRWFGGGHASWWCMLNAFVHVVMYTYYSIAAMGPQYQVGGNGEHAGNFYREPLKGSFQVVRMWGTKIAFSCLLWVNKPQIDYPISCNPWEVIISGPVVPRIKIKQDPGKARQRS